jgi:hypothetical protein
MFVIFFYVKVIVMAEYVPPSRTAILLEIARKISKNENGVVAEWLNSAPG